MARGKSRAVKVEPGMAGKKKKKKRAKSRPPAAGDRVIRLDSSSDEEAAPPAKVGKRKQQASAPGGWKKTKGANAAPGDAAGGSAPHAFMNIQSFEHVEKGTVHPKFLHTNSTSHKWAFGAIAELIDNAVDQDVAATQLQIELGDIAGERCLTFIDNGHGLSREGLAKMLGFGHSNKLATDIGRYGNGFKSGSMRLGKDALVLTKCRSKGTQSVGFLSQSFLEGIKSESFLVPMLSWTLEAEPRMLDQDTKKVQESLNAIFKYSILKSEEAILAQLSIIAYSGCCIVITKLKKDEDGTWELREQKEDPVQGLKSDIVLDASPGEPTLKRSLRAYLEVLYYQPRMQLILNQSRVDVQRILGCLASRVMETYTPQEQQGEAQKDAAEKSGKGRAIEIHVGFNSRYAKRDSENKDSEVGFFLYEKNRLICPFYKVGMHTRQDERGARVIGVVEVDDLLTPQQHKQDFNEDKKFRLLRLKLAKVLEFFWWKVRESVDDDGSADPRTQACGPKETTPDNCYLQCADPRCQKWRLIAVRIGCSKCRWSPGGCTACKTAAVVKQFLTDDLELPETFYCYMDPDPRIGGEDGQGCKFPDNVGELEELQKNNMLKIVQDDKTKWKYAMKKRKQDNQLAYGGDEIQAARHADLDRREAELDAREAALRAGRLPDAADPGTALLSPADQPETPHGVSASESESESESLDGGGEDEGLNEVFDPEAVDNIMDCPKCDPPHQVNLGLAFQGECDRCGTYLRGKPSLALQLECRLCGTWRGPFPLSKLRQLETSDMTCSAMIGGGCRSQAKNVNAGGAAPMSEGGEEQVRLVPVVVDSPDRFADPARGQAARHHATPHEFNKGTRWLEFVPGVDRDWSPENCAAGLHLYHGKEDHVLWATALPREAFGPLKTYVDALLVEEANGLLPLNTDARVSSGPVDLNQFVKSGCNKIAILDAIRSKPELKKLSYADALKYCVHVHPNQRAVYIGDGNEVSKNGKKHIQFNKAWKSNPIRSWSGGRKMADMGGDRGRELVVNQLTKGFPELEPHIAAAAGHLWKLFERELPDPAGRMQNFFAANDGMEQARLGESAWNAYNVNINYRTGQHLDHKNLPGSYSCLVILEAGPTFAGAYYLLPQFRQALNLKQGCIVFHRSGDASCGYHGNSELHQQDKYQTKRIAVVFYLSEISQKKQRKGKGGGQEEEEAARDKGKAPMAPPPPPSLAPSGPGETAAFFGEPGEPSGL